MKKAKNELNIDTVTSDTIHVGIELELYASGSDGGHDEEACYDSRMEYLNDMSTRELIENELGISMARDDASRIESYLDTRQIISDAMSNYEDGGCECGYNTGSVDRDDLCDRLQALTGNSSFKVVSDSSIDCGSGNDAEVCWNYFISKDTIKDNEKIMKFLKREDLNFNKSCGLHINLNNYLNIPQHTKPDEDGNQTNINCSTNKLDFLFNLVADSRRDSSFCNKYGVSPTQKYSMIYNQGDRLEFRFFSPTLEADKLNHYVSLAHHVYKRLAGKRCTLPKKVAAYFTDKMLKVNGRNEQATNETIRLINGIPALIDMVDYNIVDGHWVNAIMAEREAAGQVSLNSQWIGPSDLATAYVQSVNTITGEGVVA